MDKILDSIVEWLKEVLVGGIVSNLSDTGIDRIKKPREVAHDTLDQQLF